MKVSDVRCLVREAIEEIGRRRGPEHRPDSTGRYQRQNVHGFRHGQKIGTKYVVDTNDRRLIMAEQANPLDAECGQCGAQPGNACFRDRHHEGGFTSFNEYDLMPKGEYHSGRYNRANWDKYGHPWAPKDDEMTESAINEMRPYAGEKGGHKNMRDVDKWSQSRPHGEVGRPAGFAHVKKKPGKSAARQAGKKDAELDEANLEEMKPYGVRPDDDAPAPKTSKAGKHGYGNPDSKNAYRRGFKRRERQKTKRAIRAQVGESFLRRIIREEWARLLEAAGFPHSEFERAMSIAQSKASNGEDPISIGFYLENVGFMPNVVDAVLEAI